MKTQLLLTTVIFTVAAAAAPSRAQALLDQQLGPATPAAAPKPDAPKPAATDAAAKPVKPAANVGGTDIISPDAAKKVDEQDLINQLTQPNTAPASGDKVAEQMQEMLKRMGQSQELLTKKDPGEVTQETQRRIIGDLDVLIEFAKQQQNNQSSSPSQSQQPPQPGEKQYTQGNQPGQSQGGTQAAQKDTLPGGGQMAADTGDIHNKMGDEGWGRLRDAERNLISHGANEVSLTSYTDMIDRYYQALAELGKKTNR